MLGQSAMRFIRQNWGSVQQLAEELYATFRQGMRIEPSQIVINRLPNATDPAIIIRQPDGVDSPAIQIQRGSTTTNIGGAGSGGGGGGVNLGDITFPGQDPDTIAVSVPAPSDNPFPLHGVVVGKVSGRVYSVRCYARDPDTYPAIGVLPVVMANLHPDETIPAGFALAVTAFPGTVNGVRTIQRAVAYPPVFIEPEAA